jgi:hypothetical protein
VRAAIGRRTPHFLISGHDDDPSPPNCARTALMMLFRDLLERTPLGFASEESDCANAN